MEGLNWLYKLYQTKLNGILADEMGLGKTIQSIAILAQVEQDKSPQQRRMRSTFHIVIVPKVTLGKWRQEIADWAPSLRVLTFYGSKEERENQVRELRE
jgi:SWI/SNF-related matrix-associated actin-dependent regulator of chromatin subfamily A member 5